MRNHPTHCPKGHEFAVVGRLKNQHCAECTRFCPQGHEIAIVGRTPQGTCLKCNRDRANASGKQRYLERGPVRQVYCQRGHELAVVGQLANKHCAECAKLCPQGHDYTIVGKTKFGRCAECVRTRSREFGRAEAAAALAARNNHCSNGHDLAVVGVRANGLCDECGRTARLREDLTRCASGRHLIAEVGQNSDGGCPQCQRDWARETAVRRRAWFGLPPEKRDQTLQLLDEAFLSTEQYYELLKEQNEVCAICGEPETSPRKKGGIPRALAVDHDHKTGLHRGLLCNRCNRAVGDVRDNPEIALKVAEYLFDWIAKHSTITARTAESRPTP